MDTIALPVFRRADSTTVEQALAEARHRKRAGVILESENKYELLYLGKLYAARHQEIRLLSEISGGYAVHLLGANDISKFSVDPVRPTRTRAAYEGLLNTLKTKYALSGITTDTAMIITLSESLTRMLSVTGGYKCNGIPTHYFPDPDVQVGQDCPLFPACTLPGARGVPTISAIA